MTRTIAQTYHIVRDYRRIIALALIAACVASAMFYASGIYSAISYSMAIRVVNQDISKAMSDIQDLDGQYAKLSASITPDLLQAHGFEVGDVSAFISRSASLGLVHGNGF